MINRTLKTLLGGAIAGVGLLAAASSQAAYVFDGWQLDTTAAGLSSYTTNIGELSLSGGIATVTQELIGGAPIAGSRFTEFGAIFSISYVKENAPGANDFGFPQNLNNNLGLRVAFSGLEGVVTNYNSSTGELDYMFTGLGTGGSIVLSGTMDGGTTWTPLASFVAPKGGGTLNNFYGAVGTNGDSSLDVRVASMVAGLFKDSAGNALDPLVLAGRLFMAVRTNNEISSPVGAPFACDIDGDGKQDETCVQLTVLSNGSANLIPEPAVLGLLGAGLLGLGLSRRRRAKAESAL